MVKDNTIIDVGNKSLYLDAREHKKGSFPASGLMLATIEDLNVHAADH